MEQGILERTGKSLDHWMKLVRGQSFEKHGEIIKFLKEEHSFTHGYANYVAHKARESDAGSHVASDLIDGQYAGKESLRPVLDRILKEVSVFGHDVEVAPKKSAVSLRRKRQFALVQPTTKTRVDLGIKFDDTPTTGRLEGSGPFGAMCTHRVQLFEVGDVDPEVIGWLKAAYQEAG